jgi:hypothetical protein
MTTGAVILAYDTAGTAYVDMAGWCAARVQQWLDVPVSLITDRDVDDSRFDQVITHTTDGLNLRYDPSARRQLPWHNHTRCDVFDLSPYDRTLVLDADFVINSTDLRDILHRGPSFLAHRKAYNLATGLELCELNEFGRYRMPMWWATVIIFDRNRENHIMFEAWRMIRDHWHHYCNVYSIDQKLFRNDYAMSMALALMSGHTLQVPAIPWNLATAMPGTELSLSQDQREFRLSYRDSQDRIRYITLCDQDFHAMDKKHLGDIVAGSS